MLKIIIITCMSIYHIKLSFLYNRLITRAAIIHLQRVEDRSAEEQDYCDQTMDAAMANAHGAAGVMISIGKQLIANRTELISIILPRVQNALPEAIHRVHFSYALIVFATLKMSCYTKKANTPCNFVTCLGQA